MPTFDLNTITEKILEVVRCSRPENTPVYTYYSDRDIYKKKPLTHVPHFKNFLKNTTLYNVLSPLDICIGLHYLETILHALNREKASINASDAMDEDDDDDDNVDKKNVIPERSEGKNVAVLRTQWVKEYPTDTVFNTYDEQVCVIAFLLAVKGHTGEDTPFNNKSFHQCYLDKIIQPISPAAFNQLESLVLNLLKFELPRNPEAINRFAQEVFIEPPAPVSITGTLLNNLQTTINNFILPPLLNTEPTLIDPLTDKMKANAKDAFSVDVAPTCLNDLLPAQYDVSCCDAPEPPISPNTKCAQAIIIETNDRQIKEKREKKARERESRPNNTSGASSSATYLPARVRLKVNHDAIHENVQKKRI